MGDPSSGERERLAALRELAILDTAPEQDYDDIVGLAAALCEMPIAIINFVDADRQWGKALVGLDSSEAPRDASFCARTIQQRDGVLVVQDTLTDPAWAENPQVTGHPGLRFYAGAAIVTHDGHALGSVCVADTRGPRELTADKLDALRALARQTASHLRLRQQTVDMAHLNHRLRELAIRDTLTGLPNRGFFHESLRLAVRQRSTGNPGLLFCDIDGLKRVNDEIGHHAGDELLQVTARRLVKVVREGDLVARLGGDEFVVLCTGIDRAADLAAIARKLTVAVGRPVVIDGVELAPQISIGTALARSGEDPAALLRRADAAMYAVKRTQSPAAHAGAPA